MPKNQPAASALHRTSSPAHPSTKTKKILSRRLALPGCKLLSSAGTFASLALLLATAQAAPYTWNSTTGNWSTQANWLDGVSPISDGSNVLLFGGNASYTATNDLGDFGLNQISFTNTAGTVTLNASPATSLFSLARSPSGALPAITLSSTGGATISAPVSWSDNATVTNSGSGTLLFNGTQSYANGTKQTFVNSGTGTITIADAITYTNSGTNTGLVLNLINNNSATGSFNIGNVGNLSNSTLNVGGTGVVRFAGSVGGDLFGGTTTLNVLPGGTFDFNGNGETFGAISGAGTIRSTTVGLSMAAAGYYIFSGKLTGGTGMTVAVTGTTHTLVLSGATNDYGGATTVTAGRLIVGASSPNGAAGALGNATSDVLIGNTSGSSAASLLIDTAGANIGRNVRLQSGNTGTITLGGLNATGATTYSGNVLLGTNAGAAKAVTLFAAAGGTTEFTGGIIRATGATGAADNITIAGSGTVAFRGNNTFSGTTTVTGGTVLLDDRVQNGQKLSSTAGLTMNGGSLAFIGNDSAASTETVAAVTLGNSSGAIGGGANFNVTSGQDQNVTLNLGAITRNLGATANFTTRNTGAGLASITTTLANSAAGILGAFATFDRNDWATNDGAGNIVPLSAASYSTSLASGQHTSFASSTPIPSGGATTNTLRLTGAATVSFNSTSAGTLMLESGGLLIASTAGATTIGSTTAATRGSIGSGTGEVIVNQQSASTLTLHSTLLTATVNRLIKTGDGNLTLTGTNTYAGGTVINGGTVTATAAANLGAAAAPIYLNGGTLSIPSGGLGTISSTAHPITVGPAGGTINLGVNQGLNGGGLTGSGVLTLTGIAALVIGTNASTYNGNIIINSGVIRMNSAQLNSVASITINNGGTYEVNDDGTGTFSLATAGRFIVNGDGLGGNGALRLTDQTGGTTFADPITTLDREIYFQSTSRVQVDPGAAIGSTAQFIFTGNVAGPGGLVKSGAGVLTLTARDNTYGGNTVVENGKLAINLGNDRLPTGTSVTLGAGTNSGVLQLGGYSQTIAGLTNAGTGTANAVLGGSINVSLLTVNQTSGSVTYNGTLGGTALADNHTNNNLGLAKDGAGTLTLGGANTFNGSATVAGGTLVMGHAKALGQGGLSLSVDNGGTTVNAGATLDLNGQNNVQEVITLNGSGVNGAGALVNNSATPARVGSGIASISVSPLNTGNWTPSTITIDPSLSGAAATAQALFGLTSASMAITDGGAGFGVAPAVTVTGGTGALVTARMGVTTASYAVSAVVPGTTTTYSVAPTVALQNGAIGVAVLDGSGYVIGIQVIGAGGGFTGAPTATFSGGTVSFQGTNPTATGNATHFTVVGLNIVNAGTGFTDVPVVTIAGGSTPAVVVGNNQNYQLNGISVTDSGSGYTGPMAVNVNGTAFGAVANATSIRLASDTSVGGSGDLTLDPIISGSGRLTKVGDGLLTLNGLNTYSGGTTINGGTVRISSDANLGAPIGNVAIDSGTLQVIEDVSTSRSFTLNSGGGNLVVESGRTLSVAGMISGTGGLTKNGSGTLALIGSNSYSGPTLINAGTLVAASMGLGGAGTFSSAGGSASIAANLVINDGATLRYEGWGDISDRLFTVGAGSTGATLDASGAGPLWLTGTGDIALGGEDGDSHTLILTGTNSDPATSNVLASRLTGNLSLTKNGTNTWILQGNNDFSGGTRIDAGTLEIGEGGAITGTVANSGLFVFNSSGTQTFGGSLTGPGNLTKRGLGKLVFSGQSDSTGRVDVEAGTLELTGSLSGEVHVSSGATFDVSHLVGGHYTVRSGASFTNEGFIEGGIDVEGTITGNGTVNGNLTMLAGGRILPGLNGVGTFTVAGTLELAGGSVLTLGLGSTAAAQIVASELSLSGADGGVTLNLNLLDGATLETIGNVYFLLTNTGGSGVLGTFANATSSMMYDGQSYTVLSDYSGPNDAFFAISYDADLATGAFHGGNDIAVMAIPEPSTTSAVLLGLGTLSALQRFRRRRSSAAA